ncbi:MAG: C4-dicarboxylate ABC transporter [Cryomorphaceae bacterium]|nr:C4-dicarboxylate ABC transporter [Cryomorphaceae bacterium]
MTILGPILSLVFIVVVAKLLINKFYPHAVLLISGLLMMGVALVLGSSLPDLVKSTGLGGFDLFKLIKESFSSINAGVGLMIMSIGGFVAYTHKIGASNALVHLAMKPLHVLRSHPNLTAVFVIPIGQVLFICIPSAAGLSLLLMASIFPILLSLGVSRLSAASVITACTAFCVGPASAITASAASYAEMEAINYFIEEQLILVAPLNITLMVVYFFTNRYFDKKGAVEVKNSEFTKEVKVEVPMHYAIIPVLPLILLIVFSDLFSFFPHPIVLDTTTAMIISLFVAILFELIRVKKIKEVMQSLKVFWDGMGDIFKSVVTLIIAADIFAKGLISLGFVDGLVDLSIGAGFGFVGITIVLAVMIYLSSIMMGSGNAAFFAFGPLVPKIARDLGVSSASVLLPMNLAASMGRTVSPVSGIIIATAEIAGVSPIEIVKRNLIPLSAGLIVLLIAHFL